MIKETMRWSFIKGASPYEEQWLSPSHGWLTMSESASVRHAASSHEAHLERGAHPDEPHPTRIIVSLAGARGYVQF